MESVWDRGLSPFHYPSHFIHYFFFFLKALAGADITENSFYKQIHMVKKEAGLKAEMVSVLEAM